MTVLVRRLLCVLPVLAACMILGTICHEVVGHGLTAVACGGRIERVEILGLECYPRLHWLGWQGHYGFCDFDGVEGSTAQAVVSLGGSLSTWIVAVAASLLLWVRRWKPWARSTLIGLAIWWIDILTYTLPSWGVHRSILWGQRNYSEPYEAAIALGIPAWVFRAGVIASSCGMGVALAERLIRDARRREGP